MKITYIFLGLTAIVVAGYVAVSFVLSGASFSLDDAYDRWARGGIYALGRISYSREYDCIVLSSPTTGRGDLYGISPQDGGVVWSLRSNFNEVFPVATTDGDITFSRYVNGSYVAVSRRPRGADEHVILADSSDILGPVLLPDASAVVFSRRMSGTPASLTEVWIKALPGGGEKQLTHNSVHDGVVSAFRDSKRIIYNHNYSQVCLLDLGMGKSSVVCPGALPALSLDEQSVYCVRKRSAAYSWDLVKHELDTGREVLYKLDGSYISAICCLPDDRVAVVYDVLSDRVGRVAVLDTSNGQWRDVIGVLEVAE